MKLDLPEELRVIGSGPVRTVELNRPEALNAVNEGMHRALSNVWNQLAEEPELRVVILTGAGRAFSAGGDLDWFGALAEDQALRDRVVKRESRRIVTSMIEFPFPIVAAVNGPAVGLGCSLAALSDIVLVSEDAYFCDPHVSVGLVAGDGGALVWPLLMSLLLAKEALFTGARIPAAEAQRLGLANRVVAPDELMSEASKLAEQIAAQPPLALMGTKRAINMHFSSAVSQILDFALYAETETMVSPEHLARVQRLRNRNGRSEPTS